MSKTETMRQLSAAANAKRLEELGNQIEAVKQAELKSAEELATILKPLALAIAALTEEFQETLQAMDRKAREQSDAFSHQSQAAAEILRQAAASANQAALRQHQAGRHSMWPHYGLAVVVGAISAMIMTMFLHWGMPPVEGVLDPKAVAQSLKPALIEALKPSRGK